VWGIDIDTQGIQLLRSHGFGNLFVGDVCDPRTSSLLPPCDFDLVLVSEVIEHLENPGLFLRALRNYMDGSPSQILVTVPNAFRLVTLLKLLHGVEYVHPDHNYYFSYHTLCALLSKTGFQVTNVCVYSSQRIQENTPHSRKHSAMKRVRKVAARIRHSELRKKRGDSLVGLIGHKIVSKALYRRSPFWADGLIAIAEPNRSLARRSSRAFIADAHSDGRLQSSASRSDVNVDRELDIVSIPSVRHSQAIKSQARRVAQSKRTSRRRSHLEAT
jgi:Methyltransferase domain